MRRPASAILVAALIVASVLAPVAGAGLATAQGPPDNAGGNGNGNGGGPPDNAGGNGNGNGGGPPDHAGPPGHAGVPSSNVEVRGPPGLATAQGPPEHAGVWDVTSSAHSSDLSVTIESTESGEVVMQLTDDVNPEGREVSVNATTLEDVLGERPTTAVGTHESGERWSSPIEYANGSATWSVPHFSTNTVTFEGTVSITGTFAGGSSVDYSLSAVDSVDNFSVNVTGSLSTESDTKTGTIAGGDSLPLSVAGNAQPSDATVTVTRQGQFTRNPLERYGDDSATGQRIALGTYGGTAANSELKIKPDKSGEVSSLTLNITRADGVDYDPNVDIYIVQESPDQVYGEGTLVKSGHNPSWTTGEKTITLDSTYSVNADTSYTVEFVTNSAGGDEYNYLGVASQDTASSAWYSNTEGGTSDSYADITYDINTVPADVTVEGDSSVSFGSLSDGETATETVPISLSTDQLNTSTSTSSDLEMSVEYTERTETVDPIVSVNGHDTGYSGRLSDGETVTLDADKSWIQEGTNTISVSAPGGSGDAPQQTVSLNYQHRSTDQVDVEHQSTAWEESFNVSRTFADATGSPTLNATFSTNVVTIETAEYRINGGEWSTVPSYQLKGTTLVAELPDVSSGDTLTVRATGRRVQARNGEIRVLEPTVYGDDLDTKIEVVSRSEGFNLDVTETQSSAQTHYLANPSWDSDTYVYRDSNGRQAIYLPNANAGSTARVRTSELIVRPSRAIEVVVEEPQTPRFRLRAGDTAGSDSVEVEWSDVQSTETYTLVDETNDRNVINSEVTNGAVTFTTDGDAITYSITVAEESSGAAVAVGGGGGSGGGFGLDVFALFGGLAVGLIGLTWAGRRFLGATSIKSNALLLVGGGLLGTVAIEAVTARSLLSDLAFVAADVIGDGAGGFLASGAGSVALGVVILLVTYLIHSRLISLPRTLWLLVAGLDVLWIVNAITDGALASGLEEVSPLAWLILLVGGVALLWRILQPRDIIIGGKK